MGEGAERRSKVCKHSRAFIKRRSMPENHLRLCNRIITRLKNLRNTEDNQRLISNFFSLSVLQGANYILPLITLPYLTRVLGVEYFGLLAFATATVGYFQIITDYGFNLSATREISVNRDNKDKIIEIFSSVMTIKIILMVLSFIMMTILVFTFKKFSQHWEVYFLTFGLIIGQTFFPVWFFQGHEKMKYMTYLNILAKSIFTIAVFIFVRNEYDYWKVPLLTSIGFIVVGVLSQFIIIKKFMVSFEFQSFIKIKYYLKDGWHIFISGIFTSFYTLSVTFILGVFSNDQVVGYYSLSAKVVGVVSGIFSPLNGAIYPYVSNMLKTSKDQAKSVINKILTYSTGIMIFFSTLIFIFAKTIVYLLASQEYEKSIVILRMLAFLPVILNAAIIIATNYLINFGFQSKLAKIYLYSGILSLILSFTLVPLFFEVGSAITVLLVELFATCCMLWVVKKNIFLSEPNLKTYPTGNR